MSTPAELDPQHEELYRQHCADMSLNHAGLLELLKPDAFLQPGLFVPVTPEGYEQGVQGQIQYDTLKALDFLASTLYRWALPNFGPQTNVPAIFNHQAIRSTVFDRQRAIENNRRNGPVSALVSSMGVPRIQNPRLEALDPAEYMPRAQRNSWTVHSLAYLAFKAEVKRGGHSPFTAVVECPIFVTEPSDSAPVTGPASFARVIRHYKRTDDTTRRLRAQSRPQRTPKI